MDYIEGENLSSMIKRAGPLPVEKAIKHITEVGNALEYVHQHHINHLDVKPANIMIRRSDDSPILIDFGLSKQYDSEGLQTSTTPTGISHGYAPIEQYNDGEVKEFYPQTDIYSLAATLYYLVSGKVPPHATSLTQNDLSFPEGFPYFLREPISKAMSTKRGHRHESVKEFIGSIKPEDEVTLIEVPNRNRSLPTSEEKKDGNILVSNRSGSLPTSGKNNISTSNPKENKNKGIKTRERRKYNFPAFFKKNRNAIIGFCLAIGIITGCFYVDSLKKNNSKEYDIKLSRVEFENVNGFNVKWASEITLKEKTIIRDLLNNFVLIEGRHGLPKSKDQIGNTDSLNNINKFRRIDTFFIDKYELTQYFWENIMGYNFSSKKGINYPVDNVSYYDCIDFLNKLNHLSGLKFNLPTEEQWEYAALGGRLSEGYMFSGSNNENEVNWGAMSDGKIHHVGLKKPNELGLFDMTGNVLEWTRDSNLNNQILKGGGVFNPLPYQEISIQHHRSPHEKSYAIGFRLILEL